MAWDGLLTKGWVVTAGELGLTVPPEAAIVGAVPGKPAEAQVRERRTREREGVLGHDVGYIFSD